eukprot:TRINITY_DN7330_c0_g1_i3.p1 TRINITY_DN7330_c0_g1~~TRINITY_DN7330_c0_g1_i3.p1  ORF type:complete len:304 (-),score=-8.39 TRINITY_DN7330_c0_g1_i3:146-1057(-)
MDTEQTSSLIVAIFFFVLLCLSLILLRNVEAQFAGARVSRWYMPLATPRICVVCASFMFISLILENIYSSLNETDRFASSLGKPVPFAVAWIGSAIVCYTNIKTAQSAIKLRLGEHKHGVNMIYFVAISNMSAVVATNIVRPYLNHRSCGMIVVLTSSVTIVALNSVSWYHFLLLRQVCKQNASRNTGACTPRNTGASSPTALATPINPEEVMARYIRFLVGMTSCFLAGLAFQGIALQNYVRFLWSAYPYFGAPIDFDPFPSLMGVLIALCTWFFWKPYPEATPAPKASTTEIRACAAQDKV